MQLGVEFVGACQPRMLDYEMTHGKSASSEYGPRSMERPKEAVQTPNPLSSNGLN